MNTINHEPATTNDRDAAIALAGALQIKVDDVYQRNDSLEAECDSLKTAFAAVSSENENLRKERDKLVRQRDAANRRADLYESKMKIIYAEALSALQAAQPQQAKTPEEQRHLATVTSFAQPHHREQQQQR
jgi:FtsZ-binding cell division protein ZapB